MRWRWLAAAVLAAGCGNRGVAPGREWSGSIGANPVLLETGIPGPVELELDQFDRDLELSVNGEVYDSREAGPETVLLVAGEGKRIEIRPRQGARESRWRLRVVRMGTIPHFEERRQSVAELHSAKQWFDKRRIPAAVAALERAEALAKAAGDAEAAATAVLYRGTVAAATGRYEEAIQLLGAACPGLEKSGSAWMLAECVNNTGHAHWRLGRFQQAEQHFRAALARFEALGSVRGTAAATSNLGLVYSEVGEFSKSLGFYDRAARFAAEAGDRPFEAAIHNNIAMAQRGLGRIDEARGSFEKARSIFEALGDRRSAARVALRSAGMGFDSGEDPSPVLAEARRIRAPEDVAALSAIRTLEGRLAARHGKRHEAVRLLREALATAGNVPVHRALILHELGVALGAAGGPQFEQALALRRELGAREGTAETLYHLAAHARSLGRLELARQRISEAIEAVEGVRLLVSGPGHRMSYLAARRRYHAFAVDLFSAMGRREDAFEMAERSRARALLDQLGDSAGRVEETAIPATARERDRIVREIRMLSLRLQEKPSEETRRCIAGLFQAHDLAEAELHASAELAGLRPPVLRLREMLEVAGTGTMLLQYFLAEQRSWVWIAGRDGVREIELPGQARIERAVAECARLWTAADAGPADDCLAKLRAMLVPGAATAQRIIVAPDGILYRLPFAAMVGRGAIEVVTVPSLSSVAALRRRARTGPVQPAVILADPVFDASDPRLADPRASDEAPEFRRLGFTRREAMAVAQVLPGSRTHFDFEASREFVSGGEFSAAGLVHVASHAVADERQPELSRLVLSRYSRDGGPIDGSLYLSDIARMKLRARLVTLSACSAGRGKRVEGEGPIHLARAFLHAGAGAVVVSLWDVDDEAAAQLMRRFYGYMQGSASRSPAAAALLAAQRDLAASGRWRHPFFWAGWTLIGDWR